jgi:hypothetical protein
VGQAAAEVLAGLVVQALLGKAMQAAEAHQQQVKVQAVVVALVL